MNTYLETSQLKTNSVNLAKRLDTLTAAAITKLETAANAQLDCKGLSAADLTKAKAAVTAGVVRAFSCVSIWD